MKPENEGDAESQVASGARAHADIEQLRESQVAGGSRAHADIERLPDGPRVPLVDSPRRKSAIQTIDDVLRVPISKMSAKLVDDDLELLYNQFQYPSWRITNIVGLTAMIPIIAYNWYNVVNGREAKNWYAQVWSSYFIMVAYGFLLVIPLSALALLCFQAFSGHQIPSPKATSIILCTLMFVFLVLPYVLMQILAARLASVEHEKIEVYNRVTVPVELAVIWTTIMGFQMEFRYKAVMLMTYLIVFRIIIRSAFAYDLFLKGDWASSLQVALCATCLWSMAKMEKLQKRSYLALRLERDGRRAVEKFSRSLPAIYSKDSLESAASGRLDVVKNSWTMVRKVLAKYGAFVQKQDYELPDMEIAFRRSFSEKLCIQTRVLYGVACGSALFSLGAMISTHGFDQVDKRSASNIGIILPMACLLGILPTVRPSLGAKYPHRQQITTLIMYTLVAALSLYTIASTLPNLDASITIVAVGPQLDSYLAGINFYVNLIMARSGAGILRGRYALACAGIDLAATGYMFSIAQRMPNATLVVSSFALVSLFAGLVVQPWVEKCGRRYFRIVIWRQPDGTPIELKRKGKRKARLITPQLVVAQPTAMHTAEVAGFTERDDV